MNTTIIQTTILIGLFFCHLLADYTPLSTGWMLNAKRLGKPFTPIMAHAMVHTLLMGIFLIGVGVSGVLPLMILQFVTHFFIDVMKGRMNGWFPSLQNPANKSHWVVFGTDQYLHALVIILMSFYAVR